MAAGGKSVKAIGEIGAVGCCRDDEYHYQDKQYPSCCGACLSHPSRQRRVVEVVVFDKWYGGDRGLDVGGHGGRLAHLDCCRRVGGGHCHGVGCHQGIVAYGDVGRQDHGQANNQAQADLAYYLELAFQSVLVVTVYLDVVVKAAEHSEPYGGAYHEKHVDVGQVAEQKARNEYGHDDDDAAHSGGSCLLHLALKAQVAYNLAYLHQLQAVDYASAEDDGYEQ